MNEDNTNTMGIAFTVEDTISGGYAPVQNVDENISLQEFLATLEQYGFGPFSELSGLIIDGKFTTWNSDLLKESLAGIGITDGAYLTLHRPRHVGFPDSFTIGPIQSIPEVIIGPIQPIPQIMIGPIQPIPQPIIGYDDLSDLALFRIVLLSNLRMSAYTRPNILAAIQEKKKKGGVIMTLSALMRKAIKSTPLGEIPQANLVLTCSEKKGTKLALHLLHSNPEFGEFDSDINVFEMIDTRCKECGQKFTPNYNLRN